MPSPGGFAPGGDHFPRADELLPFVEYCAPSTRAADRAIESALRSVPLPDGLMTRLNTMVYRMSDEAADSIDYLGC
ncbi:MAG TPA: hypothetical protein VFW73_08880 [Lacipirellulaceae bacterium]|nr:hypothetical protein [Lacipirellulaceae bacterium]